MQQFARFLEKLRSIREPSGDGTLLDHTMVLMGSGMGNANSHTNTDLPIILAGGGFRHGEHRSYPEEAQASRAPVQPVRVDAPALRRRDRSLRREHRDLVRTGARLMPATSRSRLRLLACSLPRPRVRRPGPGRRRGRIEARSQAGDRCVRRPREAAARHLLRRLPRRDEAEGGPAIRSARRRRSPTTIPSSICRTSSISSTSGRCRRRTRASRSRPSGSGRSPG